MVALRFLKTLSPLFRFMGLSDSVGPPVIHKKRTVYGTQHS